MDNKWLRVSRRDPCPVCKKPDWCCVTVDGKIANCMRAESSRLASNGGWLHNLSAPVDTRRMRTVPPPQHIAPDVVEARWGRWLMDTSDEQLAEFSAALGLSVPALVAVRACWAWPHDAWGFPMCDGNGNMIGMRLRNEAGDKWAMTGSRQGVFLMDARACSGELFICEGPTDLAALAHIGLWGLGRPSCTGAVEETVAFCRSPVWRVREVTIIADNDSPGISGAEALAARMPCRNRIVALPHKDIRAYVTAGGDVAGLAPYLKDATWRYPRCA